jgi:hypothetical protein
LLLKMKFWASVENFNFYKMQFFIIMVAYTGQSKFWLFFFNKITTCVTSCRENLK